MAEHNRVTRILIGHFFRRFFDNDTIQNDGDTTTTVARAIAIVAVPGLLVSFFLQTEYWRSPPWVAIEDRYFFVLFSFVAMGIVSIFEWEMLFPDRLDFLILSPLSVKPVQMLVAKVTALGGFLVLFLFGSNLFGSLILPCLNFKGPYLVQLYAHAAAVVLAGTFAALLSLAIGGVLLCIFSAAQFKVVSPIAQMVSVMALVLLMLQYARYGESIGVLLSQPLGMARWMPPIWFLAVYEQLLHGDAAPPFAHELMPYAIHAITAAAALVVLTYPTAWARMHRTAIEGDSRKRGQPSRWLTTILHRIVRQPGERAVFHFIGQTIRRNNRYQVYLAMYCGTGLALALACAIAFRVSSGKLHPGLSDKGLHAIAPLLLFWAIAGLRTAFAYPINLQARWVFRITGVRIRDCVTAARWWSLISAYGNMLCILVALRVAGWDLRHLVVQAVCGLGLCVLLTDGFFYSQQSIPFSTPRMPGRTNFPLLLTLYVGVFPPFIYSVVYLEERFEKNLLTLLSVAFFVALIHFGFVRLRDRPEEIEEEMEGYEGEFQLLNLS